MKEASEERIAKIIAWSLVAIPVGLFLAFTAWLSTFKLGVPGGLAYGVALLTWGGLVLWRWMSSPR